MQLKPGVVRASQRDAMTKARVPEEYEDEPTAFLTVDLEVYSRRRLARLAAVLTKRLSLQYEGKHSKGRYFVAFGDGSLYWTSRRRLTTPDQQIVALVRLIKTLPADAAALWRGAQSRNFDIGVQCGMRPPHSYQLSLSPKTLAAATSVNAKIVVTVYAPNRK